MAPFVRDEFCGTSRKVLTTFNPELEFPHHRFPNRESRVVSVHFCGTMLRVGTLLEQRDFHPLIVVWKRVLGRRLPELA